MATPSQKPAGNSQITLVLAILAVIILIGFVVGLGHHYLAGSSPSLAQEMEVDKHPIPDWVTQDAQQCQGDVSKLNATEQQKVYAAYPGQGAKAIIAAAYALHH